MSEQLLLSERVRRRLSEIAEMLEEIEEIETESVRLRDEVERLRNGAAEGCETVQPTLTDAEREALRWSIAECEREAVIERSRAQTRNYLDCQLRECQAMSRASTLRDLLARLGGGA